MDHRNGHSHGAQVRGFGDGNQTGQRDERRETGSLIAMDVITTEPDKVAPDDFWQLSSNFPDRPETLQPKW